ncbi:hypothetical protein JZ751_000417 [Albula glossodonta]|uniref:Annexin n=1 Tax=Albula glossodonta TaxID=121402 RepID=A0A8T2PW23_9TELE|nr:hypothetical protein JZ751_000417 [Albula glossodonta]
MVTSSDEDLGTALKKALSGDIESLLLGLLMPPAQFDAHRLYQAMKGIGTDEETILEVLCTRSPQQIKDITATYNQDFGRDLEKDLISETSGDFTKLLQALLQKENSVGVIDSDELNPTLYLADRIHSMKGAVVRDVMVSRSEEDLLRVRVEFRRLTGTSLYSTLQREFKGDLQQALLALCRAEDI